MIYYIIKYKMTELFSPASTIAAKHTSAANIRKSL